jgi:AcrR family transcriptional regulator
MTKHAGDSLSRPRKKPVQARSIVTVTAILDAAAHILESVGPSAYSTNGVAERAGVSIGSLYQYFPTKDAVTRALIERESRALFADLSRVAVDTQGAEALRAMIAVAVHHQLRRPVLGRILDFEEARLPMHGDMAEAADGARALVVRCLEEMGIASGDVVQRAGDVMAITRGMVDGAGQRGEADEAELRPRVEAAVFGYLHETSRSRIG